jgi:hypothetical protein
MRRMSAVLWGSQSALLFVLATSLQAQDTSGAPPTAATQVVVISEKSALAAGVLEWAIPTVGYAYAGNWSRGILPAVVRIGGLLLVIEQQFVIFGAPPPCEGQCILGLAMAVGGTVWAVVDAGRTAGRENERRRSAALGATLVPTFGAAGPGLGVSVPVGW